MVVSVHGWTKDAMVRMVKLDSFLKESSRLQGVGVGTRTVKIPLSVCLTAGIVSLTRKVLRDLPLSNGVVVPAGSSLAVASYPIHRNPVSQAGSSEYDGDSSNYRTCTQILRDLTALDLSLLRDQWKPSTD